MSYRNVIIQEITNVITPMKANKKDLHVDLITRKVIEPHRLEWVSSADAQFAEYNITENVKKLVRHVISKNTTPDKVSDENQMFIPYPGYKYIQHYFLFDSVGVHVENMTAEQFDIKIDLHDKNGTTHFKIRDELQKVKTQLLGITKSKKTSNA